jgi:predicted alpha/beta superfamily hydrolase
MSCLASFGAGGNEKQKERRARMDKVLKVASVGAVLFASLSTCLSAEGKLQVCLMGTEQMMLKSKETGRDYVLQVRNPLGYDRLRKYPVVYLLDGDVLFGTAKETLTMLEYGKEMEEVILVGISYGKDFGYWYNSRVDDFCPTRRTDYPHFPGGGDADKFMAFIEKRVFPLVSKDYSVDDEKRVLAGYSLGALFGLYAAFKNTDLFHYYLLISPSLWWDEKLAFNWEDEYAQSHDDLPVRIVLTSGEREGSGKEEVSLMNEKLSGRAYESLNLETIYTQGDNHYMTFPAAFAKGINAIF